MLLTGLHAHAAVRGDGLRPELLDLLKRRTIIGSGVGPVVDLAAYRTGAASQAGPSLLGQRGSVDTDKRVVDLVLPAAENATECSLPMLKGDECISQ